jgi:hypothetical protein
MTNFYLKGFSIIVGIIWIITSCNNEKNDSDKEDAIKDTVTSEDGVAKVESTENQFRTFDSFVAKDEKLIRQVWGDLNKDGKKDVVMILEKTDPKNIIPHDGLGTDTLNVNPRKIVVLFFTEKGYEKIVENSRFVPVENSPVSPCLADPLEDGYLDIKKGVFRISLSYWLSCGSWESSRDVYVFRYQNEKMQLIGYDYSSYHRATGEIWEGSYNFMTMKKEKKTGGNIEDNGVENMKVTNSKIVGQRLYDMAEMDEDWSQRLYE